MASHRAYDSWSRLVGWLKVVLPIAALALLSTLFLVSNRIDPEAGLPYAQGDVEDLVRDQRMTKPVYSAVTPDGGALTVAAAEARPAQKPDIPATADTVKARLVSPDGKQTDLRADRAVLDSLADYLHLTGAVRIDDASGYKVFTETLDADLAESAFHSPVHVRATGPAGDLTADRMTLTPDPADRKSYLLVFIGNVKLVYKPK